MAMLGYKHDSTICIPSILPQLRLSSTARRRRELGQQIRRDFSDFAHAQIYRP